MLQRFRDRYDALPSFVVHAFWGLLAAIFFLYYPIGMIVVHKVNDDPAFEAGTHEVEGGSHAVAIAVALIDREINKTPWTPNDPFFMPGAALDRMPAFQKGVISALSRFAVELSDQIGRARGTSQVDPDLEKAAGQLKYPPDVWLFDFSTSIFPTTASDKRYRDAMKSLGSFNIRLSQGKAPFEKRADNLMEMLDRIANDMGASTASLEAQIAQNSGAFLDADADMMFYYVKGRMYGYYMLMRELQRDYATIIKEKGLQATWQQAVDSLREGAELSHFFVFNANPDSQFFPNHLASQGFYLLRARNQMYAIINVLLK